MNRQITPTMTLYPTPDNGGPYTLNMYVCTQIQDANIPSGETPDLPTRWFDALCAGLAYRLSRIYAPTLEQVRKTDYMEAWALAANQDIEQAPVTGSAETEWLLADVICASIPVEQPLIRPARKAGVHPTATAWLATFAT